MPVDLFREIKSIESSPDFKELIRGSYFCSAITFIQPEKEPDTWDINYYNPEKHEISMIRVSRDGLSAKGADKPFKDSVPKRVDMSKVSVTFGDAFGVADSLRKEKYKTPPNRIFASLYTEESEIWSISFILSNMQIMQVKIDACDKKLLDSKVHDLVQRDGAAI